MLIQKSINYKDIYMNKINKKSLILTVIVILAVAGFISQGLYGKKSTNEVHIGGAFGLSGQCAEFGEGELKSVQLAVNEANANGGIKGKNIVLDVEDTQCEYKSTFNAINKLINVDGASLVIGPTWGDSFQSAVPLVNKHQVPTISPSAAMEALLLQKVPIDYYFSTWFSGNSETDANQKHMVSLGRKNVVVVHDQDPFGLLMSTLFKQNADKNGINIINDYDSVTGTEDYRTILSKIQADKPEAIFMAFIGPDSKVRFLKQAREFGLKTPMYSGSDLQSETFLKSFGPYMEGALYSFPKTSGKYEDFVSAYTAAYGSAPQGPSAGNAYDAALIAIEALRKADGTTAGVSGPEVKKQLESIKLEGYSSDILGFNESHQMVNAESLMKTVKNGKFVEVK